MIPLSVGARDHRQAFAKAAEQGLLAKEHAVRAKIEIPIDDFGMLQTFDWQKPLHWGGLRVDAPLIANYELGDGP